MRDEDGKMVPRPMPRRDGCLPGKLGLGRDEVNAEMGAHGHMGAAQRIQGGLSADQ